MEAPLALSAAVLVLTASAGCAFKWRRLLGKGPRQDPEQAGQLLDGECLAALQRHGIAVHEVLGQGMFGKVFKGTFKDGVVSVKLAEVTVAKCQAKTHLSEMKIASTLKHPNVVRTHAVLADRVRPGKAGLHTRASAGSTASSGGFTWPEGQARSGGEGAMSPGELSAGSSEAGLSYNRVPSLGHKAQLESTEEEGLAEACSAHKGSPPPPPASAFLRGPSPSRRRSEDSSATTQVLASLLPIRLRRKCSGEAQSQGHKKSGGHGGNARQDLDSAREGAMAFRCIIVMDFCDGGTLWMALQRGAYHSAGRRPRLRALLRTAVEVAEGMAYIHSRRIVHGDLSSRNVLLMCAHADADATAKVSDFGLSTLFRPGQGSASAAQHGALAYMPPELVAADTLSYATDVYSFGVLLWEMLTAQTPYGGMSEEQIVQQKLHSPRGLQPPPECPGALASLIAACLNRHHDQRPSFAAVTASLHSLLATYWSDDH